MARCTSCSAPLPANSQNCRYCGTRNDIDLRGKFSYRVLKQNSKRQCPHCKLPLQTINIEDHGRFLIDRCNNCLGLFFDAGELENLLERSVQDNFAPNRLKLVNINRDRYPLEQKVKYIKCPVCAEFMSRVNFARRSGVIIDRCPSHGIWLDQGEVTHLLEWRRAGGHHLPELASNPTKTSSGRDYSIDSLTDGTSRESTLLHDLADLVSNLFD